MELRQSEKTESYPIFRVTSENNVWELGIYPVIFGFRVSCGRIGSMTYLKGGYCAGSDIKDAFEILLYLTAILRSLDEAISEREVSRMLPDWKARPIPENDFECLERLKTMAEECEANRSDSK